MNAYQVASALDALGDATRRTLMERIARRPMSVGELAAGMPITRPAVSQHLRVLQDAGLVSARAMGTRRVYSLDPTGLAEVRGYWERFWSTALERYAERARALVVGDEPDTAEEQDDDGDN